MREQERRRGEGNARPNLCRHKLVLPLTMNLEVQDCGSLVTATSKPLAPADFENKEVES